MTAGLSLITWWAVAGLVAFGLVPFSRPGRPALVGIALLGLLTLFMGLSFAWTNNEGMAFDATVQMICVLGLFLLALLISREGRAAEWIRGIGAGLGFIVLLAVLSRYFPGLGDDSQLATSLYGSSGRLSWPLGYWNAVGAVSAIGLLAVAWLAATASTPRFRAWTTATVPLFLLVLYLTSSRGALVALLAGIALLFTFERRRRRLLMVFATGLIGGAILVLTAAQMSDLSQARGGGNAQAEGLALFSLTVAVVAATVALLRRFEPLLLARPIPRPSPVAWALIAVLAVVAIVLINPVRQVDSFITTPHFGATELQRNAEMNANENLATAHLLSSAGNGRWQYWSAAVSAFGHEPLRGIGAGAYADYYTSHRDTLLYGRHAHSLPLQFLAELGLIGFLLATGFLATVLLTAWDRWRSHRSFAAQTTSPTGEIPICAAICLTGMVSMSIDWTSEFPVVAAPVLIAMAALVGPATRRPGSLPINAPTESEPARSGWLPRLELAPIAVILASGAAILFSAWGYGISSNVEASKEALAGGDLDEAKSKAQNAVDLAPWSSTALAQLAAAQELSGESVPALDSIDLAISHAPLDSQLLITKTRLLMALGDGEAALKAIVKAREIDPHSPVFDLDENRE